MVRRSSPDSDEVDDLRRRLGEAEASLKAMRSSAPPASGMRGGQAAFAEDIVAALPEGVAILEGDIIAYANAELARLLGAGTPADLLGRPAAREDGPTAVESHDGWRNERWLRGDGAVVCLEVSRKDLLTGGQKRQLVIARDEPTTAQLAAIGALAAGVAHQINNPLSSVMADLAFLGEEMPEIQRILANRPTDTGELEVRAREAAQALVEAREGAERVAAVVRDLKMLSRIDHARSEPLALGKLIDSEAKVVRRPGVIAPRPRVLIVDDEATLTSALRRALARDVEVEIRSSGAEALALLRGDDHFDLVLCDIMMPEMTGIDLYESVRARNPALASRFVFMTGGAVTPLARDFLDQITNLRLEKPFDIKQLRELIRERAAAH